MNGRQTCGGVSDIKSVCPHCGKRNFVPRASSIVKHYLDTKGTLGLSCWSCRLDIHCDFSKEKEWYGADPTEPFLRDIYELIYLPYRGTDMKKLQEKYPEAVFENGSDSVHTDRFIFKMKIDERSFFKTLIQLGISEFCLSFRLRMAESNCRWMLKEIMAELCKEHDPCIKEECWT